MTGSKQIGGASLTSGRLIARNTLINLWGYGIPLLVALFAMPILVRQLGDQRFGILSLAWVLIGYLSLLDLGLGRALMQLVANKLGSGNTEGIEKLIWTALALMTLVGVLLSVAVSLGLPLIVKALNIPTELSKEALHSFILLTVSLPIIILSVGLRGLLAAYQRFDYINIVRIPMGIFSFLAPIGVLPCTHDLRIIIAALIVGRIAGTVIQFHFVFKISPIRLSNFQFEKSLVHPLVRFGGWMTVTNAVSPVIVYVDRFFISSLVSVGAVTYYSTPHEVLTKLLLISSSLTSVLFPAFSADYKNNKTGAAFNYHRGVKYIFLVLFYSCLVVVAYAPEGMRLWMGTDFSERSAFVAQLLAIGIFYSGLGQIPYALVQGAGRPDLTGKLHFIELPFFCGLLYFAISWNGIIGAAWISLARSFVETGCLFMMAHYLFKSNRFQYRKWLMPLISANILFGVAMILNEGILKLLFMVAVTLVFIGMCWKRWLSYDEKKWLIGILGLIHPKS